MAEAAFIRLLCRADAAEVAAVAERLGASTRGRLVAGALGAPDALLDWMYTHGDDFDRIVLAGDLEFRAQPRHLTHYDSPLWDLYRRADPETNALLYQPDSPLMCRLILAGGPPGCLPPAERVAAGLVPVGPVPVHPALRARLLATTEYTVLAPAVVAADPDLVRHTLHTLGADGRLTRAERALALLRLWDLEGPDAVRPWTRDLDGAYRGLHRQMREALDRPKVRADVETTILDAARPEGFVRRLRAIEDTSRSRLSPAVNRVMVAPHTFAWGPVLDAHHRSPLFSDDVVCLVRRYGLDHAALRALVGVGPDGRPRLERWPAAEGADDGDLTAALLDACEPTRTADAPAAADLVAEAAPAWAFLENYVQAAARPATPRRRRERFALVDAELARLVRDRLGDAVPGWLHLARLGPEYPGTLPDLLDAAVAAADGPDPGPPIWADYLRPYSHDSGRQRHAALCALLRGTAPDTFARVAAHLPAEFTADLYGRPGGADVDAALLAAGAPAVDVGIFTRPRTSPRVRERLLRDPARLPALRRTLIAIAVEDPTTRPSRHYRDHYRATVHESLHAYRAALAVGDSRVTAMLAQNTLHPDGADHARESLGTDPSGVVARADRATPADADRLLAETITDWEERARAGGVVELLPSLGARGFLETVADPGWSAILAAHRAEPLSVKALEVLADVRPDLPEEPARALAEHAGEYCDLAEIARHAWPLARDLLRAVYPFLDRRRSAADWPGLITNALTDGAVDPEQWLRHGRPARVVLGTLTDAPYGVVPRAVDEALDLLVATHLAGSPDAWTTAYAMLPDFTGTVSELLSTARAATGT
ncbi:hypothetical protein [Embleya sp. NPDC020630]|uniref:hypothetical protein n=1 Tax=Embleya sp. NPDC020630 TaxID=3363979 RepID=UPI0037B8C70D